MLKDVINNKQVISVIDNLARIAGGNIALTTCSGTVLQVFPTINTSNRTPAQDSESDNASGDMGTGCHNTGKPFPLPAHFRELSIPLHINSDLAGFLVTHLPSVDSNKEQHDFMMSVFRSISQVIELFIDTSKQLQNFENRLCQAMETDLLTGLGNQRACRKFFDSQIEHANATLKPFSVAAFSLDHLSVLNETFGIKTGDTYILTAAKLLENAIRSNDKVFREMGTRLIVVMPETTDTQADALIEKLKTDLENIQIKDVSDWFFPVTVGTATWKFGMVSTDDIMESVEIALFRFRRQQARQKNL